MTFITTLALTSAAVADTPTFHYQGSINIVGIICAIVVGVSIGLTITTLIRDSAGTVLGVVVAGATAFLALTLFGGGTTDANERALEAWLNQNYADLNLTPQVDTLADLEPAVSPETGKTYQFVKAGPDEYTLVELNSVPAE